MIEINETKKEMLAKLAKEFDLELLILFGSQVTGKTHAESDFDIGFISNKELDIREETMLGSGMMPILIIRDERLINLVNLKILRPLFLYSMTQKAIVLYEAKENTFFSLQAYAYKLYIDMMPIYNYKLDRMLKTI